MREVGEISWATFPHHLKELLSILRFLLEKLNCGFSLMIYNNNISLYKITTYVHICSNCIVSFSYINFRSFKIVVPFEAAS